MSYSKQNSASRDARREALSRKAAAAPSTVVAARTRSLADFLVPGMLDLSIDRALLMLCDLTYKMQENQVLAQRLYNRLVFLRTEVETKAIGARIQSDVILRYGEQVGKAIQFLRKHASKTLVARIAANRRFLDGLRELHGQLNYFFIKVGLAARLEMHEWEETYWARDLEIRHQLLVSFLSNRLVVLGELTERGVEETLTELHYELDKEAKASEVKKESRVSQVNKVSKASEAEKEPMASADSKEPKRSEQYRLMESVAQMLRYIHPVYLPLPVPAWFVARDEVQYRQEPFAIGSYGALYRGVFERTGAKVAVKSMYSDSKQTQLALFRECTLWAKLDHPNVLKLKGACYVGSPMFFLCEDAGDHRSLPEFLTESPRNKLNMWRLLLDAANGLAYLHRLGLVHNNLKGSNILIGVDNRAKLCDFGFSFDTTNTNDTSPKKHTTASRWKAPELLLASTDADSFPTFASDVYALGMCIIEAVTGDRPWGRTTLDQQVIQKATTESYPRPDGLTDMQWKLVEAMCAFEAKDRPAVKDVVTALQEVIRANERRAAEATKMCAKCSSTNPSANKFCNECGNRFP